MRRALVPLAAVLAAASLAGCEDFATPADLDRLQIVAVVVEPPVVAPGESAALSVVVVGPDGPVSDVATRWQVVPALGRPALGRVEGDGSGARYLAPEQVDELPNGGLVEVTATVGEIELSASKVVAVGDLALFNPSLAAVELAGLDAGNRPRQLRAGATVSLEVALDPPASDDATFAWYSTAGTIEQYKRNPSQLEVGDTIGPAWLVVVARDHGGQAWRAVELSVGE